MNTPIRARLTALAASILVTFTVVHVIANYARPADEPVQLAASRSAGADHSGTRVDDASLVAAVESR